MQMQLQCHQLLLPPVQMQMPLRRLWCVMQLVLKLMLMLTLTS
jgi:hypothetical protein